MYSGVLLHRVTAELSKIRFAGSMRAEIPFAAGIIPKQCDLHGMCAPPSAKNTRQLPAHVVFACLSAGEPYAIAPGH